MTTQKLKKILSLVGEVSPYRTWQLVQAMLEGIKDESIQVIEKSWADTIKNKYIESTFPLDLSDISNWRTQEDGTVLVFSLSEESLVCEARIYDCHNVSRYPKALRFTATLSLPMSFITGIEGALLSEWQNFLSEQYEKHLEEQKMAWIATESDKLLNPTQP